MSAFRRGAALALALAVLSAGAQAQDAQVDVPVLAGGFTPDPLELSGRTVGASPLSAVAPGCRGYVGERPDHVLDLRTRFGFLRFFVTAEETITLALRGPDGRFVCSGRPLYGAPREEGAFPPGRYEVWIGSRNRGVEVPYRLYVTEFRSVTPRTSHATDEALTQRSDVPLAIDAEEGRFEGRRLRAGFLPDPRENEGVAGGPIDAGLVGGACRGRVSEQPNHVLELREALDYFRIDVEADAPVTLVVRTPSGAFLCSAPDGGQPSLERGAWDAGRYRIWVGSRAPDAEPSYRIRFSELRPSG